MGIRSRSWISPSRSRPFRRTCSRPVGSLPGLHPFPRTNSTARLRGRSSRRSGSSSASRRGEQQREIRSALVSLAAGAPSEKSSPTGCTPPPGTTPRPGAQVARAAGFYLWTQVEAGHGCPGRMTYAAVPALRAAPSWPRSGIQAHRPGLPAGAGPGGGQGGGAVRHGDDREAGRQPMCGRTPRAAAPRRRRPAAVIAHRAQVVLLGHRSATPSWSWPRPGRAGVLAGPCG